MADAKKKYTHIAVEPQTQRKVALLSKMLQIHIYDLVGSYVDDAWEDAQVAGLVNERMLSTDSIAASRIRTNGAQAYRVPVDEIHSAAVVEEMTA